MDLWQEFLGSSWGREFVAGGIGGTAGVLAGYPLDTFRIWQQHSGGKGSALAILRHEGLCALYRGMLAPLASITFQNCIVFQSYTTLSRAFDTNVAINDPPSYKGVALGGIGAGLIQSLVISPIELVKIRLQLQMNTKLQSCCNKGPLDVTRNIFRTQGWGGIYRGLGITLVRDAPSHGVYFWTYEFTREQLHPGCRKNRDESFKTTLTAGGLAGVTSWISCYPFDVLKTRIQAQSKYCGIFDCYRKCVEQEGYNALWRGIGTTLARAFIVNGAVFFAYETALRFIYDNNDHT
ncbi:mitochondrial arginine transporter bac2 [Phtheirospermum japonicum]|uniref:Mitochondrial arginine transporter bac2 n=1 Tax=Phtheirospermum japonicum TaxID=374723 RepID=A0A830CKS6_9LAMI|nr:mitochondrial arginine transporter bac2 [Phtheirospermum japonicum]